MATRHTKERLLEVMGKVNPDFKLVTEINLLTENIQSLHEAEYDSTDQEQEISPEEEQKAAQLDQIATTGEASEEDNEKPLVDQHQKGVNITVTIPTFKRKLFEKELESLKKLAKRMGAAEPVVNVSEPYLVKKAINKGSEEIPMWVNYGFDVFDVEIIVQGLFQLPGNYELAAVIDNKTGGSIEINPESPVPADKLETHGQCDLCGQERYRGKNFIVKDLDSGDYLCLGSSCVKQFIGIDPSKYIRALSWLKMFETTVDEYDMDGDVGGGGWGDFIKPSNQIVPIDKVISLIHHFITQDGYEKREWEQEQYGRYGSWQPPVRTNKGDATADKAEKVIYDQEEFDKFPVDQSYAKEFLNFAAQLDPLPPKMVDDEEYSYDKNAGFNEYRAKVQDLAKEGRNFRVFETAFLASAINYFENEKAREAKKQQLAGSDFLGQVGTKINIPYAKLTGARSGEGQYGTWYLWEFIDDQGNVLKKFGNLSDKFLVDRGTGKDLYGFNEGDVFAFTADVKKHEEYQGIKSTMLGRLSKLKK